MEINEYMSKITEIFNKKISIDENIKQLNKEKELLDEEILKTTNSFLSERLEK